MKPRLRRLVSSPWVHPLLFAAFPVLFLWSHNLDAGVPPLQGLETLAAAVTLSVAVLCALRLLVVRDWSRAAVAASVIVLPFLTLGRVGALLGMTGRLPELLLVTELALLSLVGIVAVRMYKSPDGFTRTLNLVSAVLVILNVVPIVAAQDSASAAGFKFPAPTQALDPLAAGPERDVYYLIFDRYGGAGTLRDLYGFDNSAFYHWLSQHGFVVTNDALANYPQTTHSLASSLNMSYLDGLAAAQGVDSSAWTPIRRTLQDSAIARTFRAMGYRYEHIGSWWEGTVSDPSADDNYVYGLFSDFPGVFLSTTAVPALERLLGIGPSLDKEEWDRVHFQVDALRHIASDPTPTFTFAHFLLPHPPYIFHADGSFVPSDLDRPVASAYVDQLKYTNRVIELVVSELQAAPGPAPIIVIQSDEGPHPLAVDRSGEILTSSWAHASNVELGRKLRILNAYYLPGDPATKPYRTITPVNSFRLILNDYFGAEMPLLPDRTYVFTDFDHPYRFEDITERLRSS